MSRNIQNAGKGSIEMEIKKHRKAAGLTQQQFSELFEIPLATVKAWDCGQRYPPIWAEKLIIEKLETLKTTSK